MTDEDRKHTLAGIVPSALPAFSELVEQAESWGFEPRIIEALRTCDEQRWSKNSKVHERSWHVLGRAVDLELQGVDAYRRLGEFWESMGGTWGGRWTTLYPPNGDVNHFQWSAGRDGIPEAIWPTGESCEGVRERYLAAEAANGLPLALLGPRRSFGALLLRSSFVPAVVTLGALMARQHASGGTLPRSELVAGVAVGGLASALWPILFGKAA